MHHCARCGAALVPGDHFCAACGTPVAAAPPPCRHCGSALRPDATFCPACGTPVAVTAPAPAAAPAAAPASGSLKPLWWVLIGVGAAALVVIIVSVVVIIAARPKTTDTATTGPEVFGTTTTGATRPSTTTTTTAPTTTTTAAPTTVTTAPPPPTAPPPDPVATLKNGVVTTTDGLRIQLVDGEGSATSPSDPTLRMTAYVSLAQRGTRWPAEGIVDIGAGAGGTAQQIIVLDEAGQIRQSGVFADRGNVTGVAEDGDRVRANYLERFPDDAMMAPGSIPAHATYDPVSGNTEMSPLTRPDAWCTAAAGCMDTVGSGGFLATDGYKVRDAPNRGAPVQYDDAPGSVFVAICYTHGESVDGDDRWLVSAVPKAFAWAKVFRLDTRFTSGYPAGEGPPAPGGPAPEC